MIDALVELLDDLRSQRPAVYLADEYGAWLCSIGQCINALPTAPQRFAAGVLVANDLAQAMPGTPLAVAHGVVLDAVLRAWRT